MIKTDCFAYSKKRTTEDCKVLKHLFCKNENCKFYKTVEQHKADVEKADKRLEV